MIPGRRLRARVTHLGAAIAATLAAGALAGCGADAGPSLAEAEALGPCDPARGLPADALCARGCGADAVMPALGATTCSLDAPPDWLLDAQLGLCPGTERRVWEGHHGCCIAGDPGTVGEVRFFVCREPAE